MNTVLTEEYNVTVNSRQLIRSTEYLTPQTRCRKNQCRYKRVRLHMLHTDPIRSVVNSEEITDPTLIAFRHEASLHLSGYA